MKKHPGRERRKKETKSRERESVLGFWWVSEKKREKKNKWPVARMRKAVAGGERDRERERRVKRKRHLLIS